MLMAEKLKLAEPNGFIFPHVHQLFKRTLQRANLSGFDEIGGLEVYDCFNITEYMMTFNLAGIATTCASFIVGK
jgi:acetyl-CoA C-acetyltransferase